MELHPHFQQPELFDYVRAHGIEPIGYCPIGSPNRPQRDRTPEEAGMKLLRRPAKPTWLPPARVVETLGSVKSERAVSLA